MYTVKHTVSLVAFATTCGVSMSLEPILQSASIIGTCVFVLWLISIRIRDVSIADIWWEAGELSPPYLH